MIHAASLLQVLLGLIYQIKVLSKTVNDSLDIADLIVEIRKHLGLTQEQFAAHLGVTFPTVNRWENKRSKPSRLALNSVQALLKQMGEPGAELLKKYFPR